MTFAESFKTFISKVANPVFSEAKMTEETTEKEFREIRKWIRGYKKGSDQYTRLGFLLASYNKETKEVHIGWSICTPSDNFNSKTAENIARGRINKLTCARIPYRYLEEVCNFVNTCERYYKTDNVYVCCANDEEEFFPELDRVYVDSENNAKIN
jgi:hypothetical protein